MNIPQLCWIILYPLFSPNAPPSYQAKIGRELHKHYKVCVDVANEAKKQNVNPALAISIAYHETRLSYVKSPIGAQGPMQVITKYHCPKNKPCDLIKAGISALIKCRKLRKTLCGALALYNRGFQGKCEKGRPEYYYAQKIIKTMKFLQSFNSKNLINIYAPKKLN
jgi:hypothetical protein